MNGPEAEIIYDPKPDLAAPRKLLKGICQDLFFSGRELAWRLFVRNLRGMYRQTLLGMFWIFLPPIANTAIWVFLRSRNVFDFSLGESAEALRVDTTLYILTGMILWQSFVDGLQMPLNSVSSNRGMIGRLNFPREALILEGLYDLFFNLFIRLLLLVPAFAFLGGSLHFGLLLAVPLIFLMVIFAVGLGLILMPFGTLYHDIPRFISIALPFWMIITPIIYYLPNQSPASLLNWLNPASPLLVASRDSLLFGGTEHVAATLVFGVLAIPVFFLGLVVFRVAIPAIVERMVVT
jgi:lipopolysaccharide transport system permease protein